MHMVLERTFVTAVCNFGVVSLGIFLQSRSHRARKAFRRRGRPGSGGNSVYPASTVAVTVDTRIIKRLRDRWLFISGCWLLSYRLIFFLFFLAIHVVVSEDYKVLVIGRGSFPSHDLLACLTQSPCTLYCHCLRSLASHDTLHPCGVGCLAQWTPLLPHVCRVHGAKPLAKPHPKHIHGGSSRGS